MSKTKPNFEHLCEINPTLKLFERMCELVNMDHRNKLCGYWYHTIKPLVVLNVGHTGQCPEELRNSAAYDLVYSHLCKKLGMED